MKTALVYLLSFCALVSAQDQDKAGALARILARKGTISAIELAKVEATPAGDRLTMLATLLQDKGLLTAEDLAELNGTQTTPAPGAAPAVRLETPVQSRFPITVYGTILWNSFYNTAATNSTDIPLYTAKQGSDTLGNDKNFGMTARQSRFGMRYAGGEIAGGRVNGQVEFDFLGGKVGAANGINMDMPRLRLAFGRIDWERFSFEAGQDWSLFAPLGPTSLAEFATSSMSTSGNPWIRTPQIRGEFHGPIGGGMKLLAQVAAVDPDMGDYTVGLFSSSRTPGIGERGRTPGVDSRFALTKDYDDRAFTVGVSSHYAHGKNTVPVDSWGVAIDYSLPFAKWFNVTGETYTGRALGIFSVTSGEAILPVGGLGQLGVRSSGGWTQAQFNFMTKWQLNLVYGLDDPRVRDLPAGSRTRNQTYMGNLMYRPIPHVTFAWEYRRLLTDFRNQPAANERGDHANMAVGYIF